MRPFGRVVPTKRSALWPETHFRRFLAFGCNYLFEDQYSLEKEPLHAHAGPHLPPESALNAVSFHTVTAGSIAHAKQIKPAGATAKLAQNSALSVRWEKGICILCCNFGSRPCELGAKQTIFQDEPGGRLQSRLRGSLEAIEIAQNKKCKDEGEFRGKPRRLKLE